MKFGKEFSIHLEETLPDWRDKFLCYKYLKKFLKSYPDQLNIQQNHAYAYEILHQWFVIILNAELRKFNDFYTDKEEDFIIRFQVLKERIERIKQRSCENGAFTSQSEFSEEMMEIRKDVVKIHGEMVLLKNYSSLNFAGLVKILKKYERRTGRLLRLPYTQLAAGQPFFVTEPLTRLVHECEANLELLFPLEAEVVEPASASASASARADHSGAPSDSSTNPSSTVGEEAMNIYRSTISAIQTIRGLQKKSSTNNPLSISSFLRVEDEEDIGSVTSENSASRSPSLAPNGEDGDPEDGNASSG